MKTFILSLLLAGTCLAAPPRCKTVQNKDGSYSDVCERDDATCSSHVEEFLKESNDDWKRNWHGCAWPAIIQKALSTIPKIGFLSYHLSVTLVASYVDSERMDVTIFIESRNHEIRTVTERDIPVVIDSDLKVPIAQVSVDLIDDWIGVPTVEALEKGGARKMSHRYR